MDGHVCGVLLLNHEILGCPSFGQAWVHGIWNGIGWDGYHDLHEACALLHDMPQSLCSSYGSVDGVANASWYPQKVLEENFCENGSCTIPHRSSQILSVGQHGSDQTLSRHLRHVSLVAMNSVPQLNLVNLARLAEVPMLLWRLDSIGCVQALSACGRGHQWEMACQLIQDMEHRSFQPATGHHWAMTNWPLVDGWKKGVMLSTLDGSS